MTTTAVLFDIDGTLTDTNYLHALAWRRAFVAAGQDVATARIHRLIGASGDVLLRELLGSSGREDVKDGWRREFDRLKGDVRAFPGAADLLRAVAARGARVVLATSSEPADVSTLRAAIAADDVIHATDAGDVDEAKPAPDVFTVAMERAGVADAGDAIVVGDSRWDVEAARRAGLDTVGLLGGGISAAELEAAGAVAIYDDPAALLAHLDGSPLARLLR